MEVGLFIGPFEVRVSHPGGVIGGDDDDGGKRLVRDWVHGWMRGWLIAPPCWIEAIDGGGVKGDCQASK